MLPHSVTYGSLSSNHHSVHCNVVVISKNTLGFANHSFINGGWPHARDFPHITLPQQVKLSNGPHIDASASR